MASLNTTVRQMTKLFQWPKCPRKNYQNVSVKKKKKNNPVDIRNTPERSTKTKYKETELFQKTYNVLETDKSWLHLACIQDWLESHVHTLIIRC